MEKKKESNYVLSTTVQKAFSIIECVAHFQPVTPVTIQKHLKMNKGNIHRLLATLEDLGYVKKIEAGYIITFKMYALGNTVLEAHTILQIAKPYIVQLSEEMRHNISLLVIDRGRVIRLYQAEYPTDLKVLQEKDFIFPLHCSATGKLYLSHLKGAERDSVLENLNLVKKTEFSISDKRKLLEELERIKTQGYATEIKEYSQFMHCLAVPIYDHHNNFIASVSLTSPSFTFPEEDFPKAVQPLLATAKQISRDMGAGVSI